MNKIELARLDQVGRGATLKVASLSATAKSKAAADYVCTGENDEVIIRAAIQELDGIGGCVELSEGTFNISAPAPHLLLNANNIWLKGQGMASVLSGEYSNIIISAAGVKVSDLRYMGKLFVYDDGDAIIDSCYIGAFEIVSSGGKATMTNSNIDVRIINAGELIINSSTTPELITFPSIIPSTLELIQGTNNIPYVYETEFL